MINLAIKHRILTSEGHRNLTIEKKIYEGSFVLVKGESGIGKTTFFKIFTGLLKPDEGFIEVNGRVFLDIKNGIFVSPQKRDISMMFQSYVLFPNMTVRQNITFAQKKTNPEMVDYFLNQFNLKTLQNRLPSSLSGGQKQRVALARTLVQNAEVVLLDEPLSSVDEEMKKIMLNEIIKFHRKEKSTFFMISHNERELEGISYSTIEIK